MAGMHRAFGIAAPAPIIEAVEAPNLHADEYALCAHCQLPAFLHDEVDAQCPDEPPADWAQSRPHIFGEEAIS